MYVRIGNTTYTGVKNLNFDPEADVTGASVPVNQFSVDVMSETDIDVGGDIYLYDDLDQLWAKFWLTDTYRVNDYTVRLTAQSLLCILDRITMAAKMYDNEGADTVIAEIFAGVTAIYGSTPTYYIDPVYTTDPVPVYATIDGYAPEQTARERLQWCLFCMGALCKQSFVSVLEFVPVYDTPTLIPFKQTYWKPEYGVGDYVTGVQLTAYYYVESTPATTDKWVEVGGHYYVQTTQVFSMTNPNAPNTAPENIVKIDNVTIINENNVSSILTRLATYYFMRGEITAEIINNKEFWPGERVTVFTGDDTAYSGYITSMNFTFGTQAKSQIKMVQTETIELANLFLIYQYNGDTIRTETYPLPVNYVYNIQNPYIDQWANGHRYIYYPLTESVTGTLTEDTTVTVAYGHALDEYNDTLTIYSVDEYTTVSETEGTVIEIE